MKATVVLANKIIKRMQEDIDFTYQMQNKSSIYTEIPGQDPVIPRYDFHETQSELAAMEKVIQGIKHAINVHNTHTQLEGFDGITIDQALVKMAQMKRRLSTLDTMRSKLPRELDTGGYFGGKQQTQYTVTNYDPHAAAIVYNELNKQMRELQLALDASNNTEVFEIPYET